MVARSRFAPICAISQIGNALRGRAKNLRGGGREPLAATTSEVFVAEMARQEHLGWAPDAAVCIEAGLESLAPCGSPKVSRLAVQTPSSSAQNRSRDWKASVLRPATSAWFEKSDAPHRSARKLGFASLPKTSGWKLFPPAARDLVLSSHVCLRRGAKVESQ